MNRLTPLEPRQIVSAIVLTNIGLLAALICGPNSTHPNVLATRIGIGVMVLGLVLLAGAALSRKRAQLRHVGNSSSTKAL